MTCEFPHATPADCSAHSYNRGKYEWIVPQMVSNGIDVLIGGGTSLLTDEQEAYLRQQGASVYRDDLAGMRADTARRMWALYGRREMDYDLDRDSTSAVHRRNDAYRLEQTLQKSQRLFPDGGGSKVDWGAHNNDPVAVYTEYQAFDRAVGEAIRFAQADGQTAVIITADTATAA